MNRHHAIALLGLAALCATSPASAFQPLITDDSGTQGKGGNQFELSVTQDRERTAGEYTSIRTLPLVYTRGLCETFDAYLALIPTNIRSNVPHSDASGAANPALGAKWRYYENEDSKTSLAVKPEIRLPVAAAKEAAGLGSGRTSYGLLLILTQELPFGAIHANLARGRDLFRYPEINPHLSTAHASIAPVWNLGEQWKLALDLGREMETAAGIRKRFTFLALGAVYSPDKELDLALGFIRRSDSADNSTNSATLGATWHF